MAERKARPRLGRADWVAAALAVIADGGWAAVSIERLAAGLGTTKGSFYWHFANREALLEATLATWENQHTDAVLTEVGDATDDPAGQLRMLVSLVVRMAERDAIGPALLANAGHPMVAPVLARVTRTRIDAIASLFARLGLPPRQARSHALLAYSAYLGHAQLIHSTPKVLPDTPASRHEYLDHVLVALTARHAATDPRPTT